jgi:hypothetical protein
MSLHFSAPENQTGEQGAASTLSDLTAAIGDPMAKAGDTASTGDLSLREAQERARKKSKKGKKGKKLARGPREFISAHPKSRDKNVKLPRQHQLAVKRVKALIAGKQPRPVKVNAATAKSGSRFPTDPEMDAARAWLEAEVDPSKPESTNALKVFREGERIIKARRRGAQQPRTASDEVIQRLQALIPVFRELPSGLQQHHTGQKTLERLRSDLIQKLGLPDNDDDLSEDTIRKDIEHLRPLIRLVQEGKMPPPGQPPRAEPSELTLLVMEAGRRAIALAEARRVLLEIIQRRFLRNG